MNEMSKPAGILSPALLARFAAIVGEKYAITDTQAQEPYLVEMRHRWHGRTAVVLRPGSVAEQVTFDAIEQKPGWTVIRDPVHVRDATGQLRVYDGAAISPSGRYIGLETKSGAGRLTPAQRAFDTRLNSSKANTAPGVGQSSKITVQRAIEVRR